MGAERDPMTPELRRLLDLEATRSEPTHAERNRVRRQLEARISALASTPSGRWRFGSAPLWVSLGAVAASGLVWKLTNGPHPARAASVPAFDPAPAPEVVPPVTAPASETPALEPPVSHGSNETHRRTRGVQASKAASLGDPLDRERDLIERARTVLRTGHPSLALSLLREHESAFPSGILSEERSGLEIEALIADGQLKEARQRVANFRARYPVSPLLPAIDAAFRRGAP